MLCLMQSKSIEHNKFLYCSGYRCIISVYKVDNENYLIKDNNCIKFYNILY